MESCCPDGAKRASKAGSPVNAFGGDLSACLKSSLGSPSGGESEAQSNRLNKGTRWGCLLASSAPKSKADDMKALESKKLS
jgi:hypothetical protein